MCGIAGQFALGSHLTEEFDWINRAIEKLIHRGPDSQSIRNFGRYSIAHTRLAIIDLTDDANQPFENDEGVLIFNGEIYNFKELAKEFGLIDLKTQSDTEVLFRLLQLGENFDIVKIRGMFSFAYWDKKKNVLKLARDHIGQKPLYYGVKNDTLYFSSYATHVFEVVGGSLSDEGLSQYESLQVNFAGKTLFERVQEIPPGHLLEVQGHKLELTRYWKPEVTRQIQFSREELLELIDQAVRRTLIADVNIGITLSGGLDSALVSGFAARFGQFSLYHGLYANEKDCDESLYAASQARFLSSKVTLVNLSSAQFDSDVIDTLNALDVPTSGPGSVGQFAVAREISKKNKVCLGGLGGDELFCGYSRYFLLDSGFQDSKILNGYEDLKNRFRSVPERENTLVKYFSLISRDSVEKLVSGKYKDEPAYNSFFQWVSQSIPFWMELQPMKLAMLIDQLVILPGLLHVEDGVSMNFGLEGRLPLIDVDLLNFANNLDLKLILESGPKAALRLIAKEFVSPSISSRQDKMGFPVPLNRWIEQKKLPIFSSHLDAAPLNNQWGRESWGKASLRAFKSRNKLL